MPVHGDLGPGSPGTLPVTLLAYLADYIDHDRLERLWPASRIDPVSNLSCQQTTMIVRIRTPQGLIRIEVQDDTRWNQVVNTPIARR